MFTAHVAVPALVALAFLLFWLSKKTITRPALSIVILFLALGFAYQMGKFFDRIYVSGEHVRAMQCGLSALDQLARDGRIEELRPRLERLRAEYGRSVYNDQVRFDLMNALVANSVRTESNAYSFGSTTNK